MDIPEIPETKQSLDIHLSVGVLALAVAIFFYADLRKSGGEAKIMSWQLSNLDRQAETLRATQIQLANLRTQREEAVKQVQGPYMNLFNDLLDLAKTDKDIKEVADKMGIKRNEPAKPDAAKEGDNK